MPKLNVFLLDVPLGGHVSEIPNKNKFGVRVRVEMTAEDKDDEVLMKKMIEEAKSGKVKVVNMMNWQDGNKGFIDMALVFSR